jgi:hypothetical protein
VKELKTLRPNTAILRCSNWNCPRRICDRGWLRYRMERNGATTGLAEVMRSYNFRYEAVKVGNAS